MKRKYNIIDPNLTQDFGDKLRKSQDMFKSIIVQNPSTPKQESESEGGASVYFVNRRNNIDEDSARY